MMNPCSNSKEQRDPKLNEYRQVVNRVREAGRCDRQEIGKLGSGKPTHNDDGNDTFTSPTLGSGGNSLARGLIRLKRTGEAQKRQLRNDGKTSNSSSQRLFLSEDPDEEMVQADKSTAERTEHKHLSQVPPNLSPFLLGSVTFSDATKRKAGQAVPNAEAPEALGAKDAQKKQTAPHMREQPSPPLDALPGNGTRASSPLGEDTQGPSPVDYNLEIKAEFSPAMVIKMQKNTALRTRKTVIGRTLAGRTSFKDLQDYLKLHLPTPFLMVTLLMRGYFEVLFEKEERARATRKLAAVEWSGWAFSFSRYSALFRHNEHGAEKLLMHTIKVQFPDLHVQLCTEKALTIMANSIGEVLDIESLDSYIKRPAGPMVTVEVKDIGKLAGIIRIPSMAEGAGPGDTTAQRILYSGLPNQCKKRRKFGHLAKTSPQMTRPQVPCVTQRGSKELDLRNWLETWCRSQLPALKGVEGSCWKLRDYTRKRSSYLVTNLHPKPTRVS
jgi:hypothetical protein